MALVVSSGKGKTASLAAESNCPYKVKFSLKAAEKCTKSSPCTNRPVKCNFCNAIVWLYHLIEHHKNFHSDQESPLDISNEEKELVKKTIEF